MSVCIYVYIVYNLFPMYSIKLKKYKSRLRRYARVMTVKYCIGKKHFGFIIKKIKLLMCKGVNPYEHMHMDSEEKCNEKRFGVVQQISMKEAF